MWINNNKNKPLRRGYYKCLIVVDSEGSLKSSILPFDGEVWREPIVKYWWATSGDYKLILEEL